MTVSLEKLKAELERQREALNAELADLQAVSDEGMGYSNHQADDASEAYEQAATLAMRQNAERLLYLVERALQRMAAGTYGSCRSCGQPIDPARLNAIPYARYCLECAQKYGE